MGLIDSRVLLGSRTSFLTFWARGCKAGATVLHAAAHRLLPRKAGLAGSVLWCRAIPASLTSSALRLLFRVSWAADFAFSCCLLGNPGPFHNGAPHGALDLQAGFAHSTRQKMDKALSAFASWLLSSLGLTLSSVLSSAQTAALALRALGLHLYSTLLLRSTSLSACLRRHLCAGLSSGVPFQLVPVLGKWTVNGNKWSPANAVLLYSNLSFKSPSP